MGLVKAQLAGRFPAAKVQREAGFFDLRKQRAGKGSHHPFLPGKVVVWKFFGLLRMWRWWARPGSNR